MKLYFNGTVYTGKGTTEEAFAEENGKFIFVGNADEIRRRYGNQVEEEVNLEGNFVCGGFNDSHMHVFGYGYALRAAQLFENTGSLKEMLTCLKEFADQNTIYSGEWLFGRGWNHDFFSDEKRMPTRYDLDTVSKDVPICAVRACGHCLVVNSKALEMLGITSESQNVPGGEIGFTDGQPNGLFFDNAMGMVYDAIPLPGKETVKSMLQKACENLSKYGVTSSQTDDYCLFYRLPWSIINDAYRELEEEGKLTVRIYEQANFTDLESLKKFVEAGNVTGTGTEMFKIGPLKMLGDGALGAHTAFLSRPYEGEEDCGFPVFSNEQMEKMVSYANANNMQIAVHTIGDACLDQVLNAYEKALSEHPRDDHRHGIVHCQITRPNQLDRIAKLKLHVYAQSIFLDYDISIVEKCVGKELASTSYSWKTLMNKGVTVSNGSDCPVEKPDALAGMQCAVTRKTLNGDGPYLPEQAFSVEEAIKSYTSEGAKGSFEEDKKGLIAEGYLADFVVLDKNPTETLETEICNIKVLKTYVGGKKVYDCASDV